jgi:putative endonuclease
MEYGGCVYIMTNFHNAVLYTGVTSNLPQRIYQHKTKEFKTSFTAKYNCDKLVWYEWFSRIEDAITREKQLKACNRKGKEDLIHALDPHWNDLCEEVKQW